MVSFSTAHLLLLSLEELLSIVYVFFIFLIAIFRYLNNMLLQLCPDIPLLYTLNKIKTLGNTSFLSSFYIRDITYSLLHNHNQNLSVHQLILNIGNSVSQTVYSCDLIISLKYCQAVCYMITFPLLNNFYLVFCISCLIIYIMN